jgi:hypothetical protein
VPLSAIIENPVAKFVARWKKSNAAERSNFQLFMAELCDALGLPRPDPATENEAENGYVFERVVRFAHDDGTGTTGRIDLYKRGSFVLEGKQSRKRLNDPRAKEVAELGRKLGDASFTRTGAGKREGRGWDMVMAAAKGQAEAYAKALPKEEGWPPFIIVVDVGHVIEVYADFSLQGKYYAQFPDRQGYRITLDDLADPKIQERLKAIWNDPLSLDPAKVTAQVTREIAEYLALLSKSLEGRGHSPAAVAAFLMRCLFTMFAEDVGLLHEKAFQSLLERHKDDPEALHLALPHLWREMNDGGFSPTLGEKILRFNGGLFKDATALPIDAQEIGWLLLAAKRQWTNVEPAIFGTLLERALDPKERHKLGAHYTPRAYVERLVVPTIIEPLTDDWRGVQAEAATCLSNNEKGKALAAVKTFHAKLCATRVLDPACGTGNFLYVAMELMKKLEGDVLELLSKLGDDQYMLEMDRHTVDPHQFLGLEINPRAVAIAELVLWIGYLQWHFRIRGKVMPAEPVLQAFANIKPQDAVLTYDKQEILRDKSGHPLTRWDGVTKKLDPITGEEIPDPDAQVPLYKYINPRPAKWPKAEFIVGNPPYIGTRRLKTELGATYVEALRAVYPEVNETADLVMYWWYIAAVTVCRGGARRFGLLTTDSITQDYSRPVLGKFINGTPPKIDLVYAITDHPWVENRDGAKVRVAMTVGVKSPGPTTRIIGVVENPGISDGITFHNVARIYDRLILSADTSDMCALKANERMCFQGVVPAGVGFKLTASQLSAVRNTFSNSERALIKPYVIGKDITDGPRRTYIIDAFGLDVARLTEFYPHVFQYLHDRVLPERIHNPRKAYRDRWWVFAEPRPAMRNAIEGLRRFIGTAYTSKHRTFVFFEQGTVPDAMVYVIPSDDSFLLGLLSGTAFRNWCLRFGGTLETRPRFNSENTFFPFPFPVATERQKAQIRALGERLDAFRKERLAEHDFLTMTKLYNVLEKLRAGEAFDDKDKAIYEAGLVSVLKQIHDDLDVAVAEAYGWPVTLSDEVVLEKLVALNKERAAEERKGKVRWLRPEFQAPKEAAAKPKQMEAELVAGEESKAKPQFPKTAGEQVTAVRALLAAEGKPIKAGELARRFKQGKKVEPRVAELLQIMAAVGQAQTENGSRYFAVR